jgi:hypothetical protein
MPSPNSPPDIEKLAKDLVSPVEISRAKAELFRREQAVESAVENMRGEVDSFLHNVAS